MWVEKLSAQHLRAFEQFNLQLNAGLNIFTGTNGTGKTSILEAIDVLSRGKSFRCSSVNPIIQFEQNDLTVYAEIHTEQGDCLPIGLKYAHGKPQLKLNREKVEKWSTIAAELPIIDIHPESYLLVTGSPEERRRFLSWGAFHVEQRFYPAWLQYHRALKQRNECLKQKNYPEAAHWHPIMAESGQLISQIFAQYVEVISPYIVDYIDQFGFDEPVEFDYEPAWNRAKSLQACLDEELQQRNNTTTIGPHRSELKLSWHGQKFSKSSSRGQQKVLALAMKLAQSTLLIESTQKTPLYLIDELPAELDEYRCQMAIEVISGLNAQALITSVSPEPLIKFVENDAKWFHVEHGQVSEML